MDDFNSSTLYEAKNEWAARLLNILTPLIIDGYKSILDEAIKLCRENNEMEKYLMTFQNFLSRIPKWNSTIIETEKKRIIERSGCSYLEDLIVCTHIIQLKILTAMRVGQKQKKIDINIPKLDDFIHKVYISVARKIYKNIYLFELKIPPLQIQKNNRELEIITQECILNTLRESIPVEAILKAYMDETIEEEVTEEIKEEYIENPKTNVPISENLISKNSVSEIPSTKLSFNDTDYFQDENKNITSVNAPKTIERLKEIEDIRFQQRKLDEENEDDEDDFSLNKLNISNENIILNNSDFQIIEDSNITLLPDLIDDIEILN